MNRFTFLALTVLALVGLAVAPALAQQKSLNLPGNAAIAGSATGTVYYQFTEIPYSAWAAINNTVATGIPGQGTFLDVHHFIFPDEINIGSEEQPMLVPVEGPYHVDVTLPQVLNLTTLQAYVCEGSDNGFIDTDRTVSSVEFFVNQNDAWTSVGSVSTVDTDDIGCFDLVELTGNWSGVSAVRYQFTPTETGVGPRVGEVVAISPDWAGLQLTGGIEYIQEGGAIRDNNLAQGATPFAADALGFGAYSVHQIAHLNDGIYGNTNSWIGETVPAGGAYVGLALPALTDIGSIAFGRDNGGEAHVFTDRWQGEYTLQYTTSATPEFAVEGDWTTIGTIKYNMADPPSFLFPYVRHEFAFDSVQATGIRLLVPNAGLAAGTCIDEIELYASSAVVDGYEITGGITLVAEGGEMGEGNVALASDGSVPFAIDVIADGAYDAHKIVHINDGIYGNSNSWIGATVSPTLGSAFAGVAFGEACEIDAIAFGRDNTSGFFDRTLGTYTLQYTMSPDPDVTTPDGDWIDLGTVTYTGAGGENFSNPSLRHLFSFDPVTATGVRLVVPSPDTCIDELEVYGTRGGGPGLEGDLNGDGSVSSADLDLVRANWGQSVTPGDGMQGDGNGDGFVNSADLDVVRANWGRTAAASAVPEPGTLALFLGMLVAFLVRRR